MPLNAGRLDQRITPQRLATPAVKNDRGEDVTPWVNVDAGSGEIWARADPRRGREFFAAAQMQAEGPVVFEIRYRADLNERMRVLWRGVPHEILSPPVDEYGRRETMFLYCATGLRPAE
jgi:SPP1 family predicted phage head-tail adaptor